MKITGRSYGVSLYTLSIQTATGNIEEDVAGLDGIINPEFIKEIEQLVYDMVNHNKEVYDMEQID